MNHKANPKLGFYSKMTFLHEQPPKSFDISITFSSRNYFHLHMQVKPS